MKYRNFFLKRFSIENILTLSKIAKFIGAVMQ